MDVGTDQLAPELKNDPRVVSLEKTDIRNLGHCEGNPVAIQKCDLAVVDVSFISLELVLPAVVRLLFPLSSSRTCLRRRGRGSRESELDSRFHGNDISKIIALVKPQFETEQKAKNKSGVVKNEELQKQALVKIKNFAKTINLKVLAEIDSPLLGGSGNKEYFLLLGQGEALS